MKIDSIIFDLDGTLWDSTDSVINSWNETISSYKEVKKNLTAADLKGVAGLVIEAAATKIFPYIPEENRMKIIRHCCKNECSYLEKNGAVLYDKLEETLNNLVQRYKLFIVSNCQCGYIESFFKSHGLDKYFIDYENAGRTGLTKGDNVKLIIERNYLTCPVYVGDTEGDLKAARFAGIPFIYASYGFGKVKEYDYVIERFDDILRLV